MKANRVLVFLPATILTLLLSCSGGEKGTTDAVKEKVKVKVETVHFRDVEQLNEFTATVEAYVSNKIAPQSPVRIEKLYVEVGDQVKEGQLLATMDATTLNQTKHQLANQETEFIRVDELYKVGGAAKSAWDAQKTALDVTRETYRNLQSNNQLVSPISGIVTARNYDNGDMYSAALPVYVVEQIRPVKLMVNVSESYFSIIKKGMDVSVKLDVYGDEKFAGRVSLIYPTIDPATRTFTVEVKILNNDDRVRPGMFARVTMNFGTMKHIVTPDQAVVKQAGSGDKYIYVYKNGAVSYQKVELGRREANTYEVISGVADGDEVVVSGQSRLANNMEVEVIK